MPTTLIADRFELGALAGKGGMGTVHRARDRRTGLVVALKIVEDDFANERFLREASVLARLEHPGIVRYVAHGAIDEQRMYLAMEWLEGTPLDVHLTHSRLGIDDVLAVGLRLARALGAAHESDVVHRDVKPSNIVLRGARCDDAVLLDFGIARARDGSRLKTATGAAIGTPAYMAPEQVRGERQLDARADLFSLGCVLFECLAGRPPFVGEQIVAVLAKVLLEPAPKLRSLQSDVPPALDELIGALLEKDPRARPASAAEVASALEALRTDGKHFARAAASPATLAIGPIEQSFATVLLARRSSQAGAAYADTARPDDATLAMPSHAGISLQQLADGTWVGVLSARHGGPNAARSVVRAALHLEHGLEHRVAVATGRAVVAGDLPMGRAIDDAAALLASGSEPGVWLDEASEALVDGHFELSRARAREPARVVRELGAEERARTLLGKATPCVGRERELALLEATLRECVQEPIARAVIVIAEPGIGKSRLQRELVARARASDSSIGVWLGLCDPSTAGAPFALVGDLLRRFFELADGEPIETRREKVRSRLNALMLPAAASVAGCLGEICGTPFDDTDDDALRALRRDPTLLATQVEDAFTQVVCAELAKRPLLLVAEDIHWADAASLRLIRGLLARAKELPLLVLALARPSLDEVHPRLWADQRSERLVLEPLLRRAAEKLARAVLGDRPEIDSIVKRAAGNALFVEELARACAAGSGSDALPPTIAAVTEARLAALDSDARQIVRGASIFGERFWAGGVAHVIGPVLARQLDANLEFFEKTELVNVAPISRFADEREFSFRHALVRDAAYAMLTGPDRSLGHALAGAWLATRLDDGALLAHHFEIGERAEEAARWHVRAAEQALAAHQFDAVFRHRERAEARAAPPALLALALLAEAEALLWQGGNEGAARAARRALASLEPGSEKWFAALGTGVAALGKLGHSPAVLALADQLEAVPARDEQCGRLRAIARARAAIQLAYAGELRRANALLEGCDLELGALGDAGVQARLQEASCEVSLAMGEPVHPRVARNARELSLQIGDRRTAFGPWAAETQILASIGAWDEAVACVDELARAAGDGSSVAEGYRAMIRALRAMSNDDNDEALALPRALAERNPRAASAMASFAAQSLFNSGRWDQAVEYGNLAVSLGATTPSYEGLGLGVIARVAAARGDLTLALDASARALALSERGMSTHGATSIHLGRFEALRAAGRHDEATAILRLAVESLAHRSRHLGEYRANFLQSFDNPSLLALAREHGIALPEASESAGGGVSAR